VVTAMDVPDGDERLWHAKYALHTAMLPPFISPELAEKILVKWPDLDTQVTTLHVWVLFEAPS
jgi:hypothetical protein